MEYQAGLLTLEYLNLELHKPSRINTMTKEFNHLCYFGKDFKHRLHGDNNQLNSIADLIISLSLNLESFNKKIEGSIKTIAKIMGEKNSLITQQIQNLQYIKDQNSSILQKINDLEQSRKLALGNTQEEVLKKCIQITRTIEEHNKRSEKLMQEVKHILLN